MGNEKQKAQQQAQEYWTLHPNLPTRGSDGATVKQRDRCSKWIAKVDRAYISIPRAGVGMWVIRQTGQTTGGFDSSPDFICEACFDSDADAIPYPEWSAYKKRVAEFRKTLS